MALQYRWSHCALYVYQILRVKVIALGAIHMTSSLQRNDVDIFPEKNISH